METECIELDATEGGQIFRYGLGLATLLKKPVRITHIRKAASNPGIQRQHLSSLQALSQVCGADVSGVKLNDMNVEFVPGDLKETRLVANIGTAGSVSLLLQAILLPSLRKKTIAAIVGGTDVPWSPSYYYYHEILFPFLKRFGCKYDITLTQHGFFPKGRGKVSFSSTPISFPLKPVYAVELGVLQEIKIFSQSAGIPNEVAVNQSKAAKNVLQSLNVPIEEKIVGAETSGTIGSSIDCIAYFDSGERMGVNAIGKKGTPAIDVGKEAGEKLLAEIATGAAIDQFLCDQLIPFMALADGYSTVKVSKFTNHTQFAIDVAQKFCNVKFEITGKMGEPAQVFVKGSGWKP
jgi:RNA 3'-terminal phosphate cyclase (GTP)